MLVVEIRFLAGRYHATPWGRNVVEGAPEWPPSPFRLVRALVAIWKRKRADWPESRAAPLLRALSSDQLRFRLPPAGASHTRVFLRQGSKDLNDKKLIFDGFVVVSPRDGVLVGWPDVQLSAAQLKDLDELLATLDYLGRSESWVEARVLSGIGDVSWNCAPAGTIDQDGFERVRVACVRPADEWVRSNAEPGTWLESLDCGSDATRSHGLSDPPALRWVDYALREGALLLPPQARLSGIPPVVEGVRYALSGKVLPRITEALEVAERARTLLMGIHKRLVGAAKVSRWLAGKAANGGKATGHAHAHYLSLDEDHDGRIDHLLVAGRKPLDSAEIAALDSLRVLWQSRGRPDVCCVPVRWGRWTDFGEESTTWVSATPFVSVRHHRRSRGSLSQWHVSELRREAGFRELPEIATADELARPHLPGARLWREFRRNRKGDPPLPGLGFKVRFAVPVLGPIALGYGSHFGLGLFVPSD